MCPAIHINSRSWLRSSSTHEPSDPPRRMILGSFVGLTGARARPRKRQRADRGRPRTGLVDEARLRVCFTFSGGRNWTRVWAAARRRLIEPGCETELHRPRRRGRTGTRLRRRESRTKAIGRPAIGAGSLGRTGTRKPIPERSRGLEPPGRSPAADRRVRSRRRPH